MGYNILWSILKSPTTWVIVILLSLYLYISNLRESVDTLRKDVIVAEDNYAEAKETIDSKNKSAEANRVALEALRKRNRKLAEELSDAKSELEKERDESVVRSNPAGAEYRLNIYLDGVLHNISCSTGKQCIGDSEGGTPSPPQ